MYDHLHEYFSNQDWARYEYRVATAEEFLDRYHTLQPQDLYHWLWQGEFGYGNNMPELTIDRLNFDLRIARMKQHVYEQRIWEPLGLSDRMLKINIVPYVDQGGPFLKLLDLSGRVSELRPNTLRFKRNWNFMKTQIGPGLQITVEAMNTFENTIAFHMTPELGYTDEFIQEYGEGYRIVPRTLFFQNFPEYEPEEDLYRMAESEEEGEGE